MIGLCLQSTGQIHSHKEKGRVKQCCYKSHDNKLSGTLLLTDTETAIKVNGQLSD